MLVFSVKDQGPGVPPDYVERIFDRFQQAPSKAATRRGSGLGLTISKSIVDLHGGTIDIRNDAEGGCTFRVRLPINVAQTAAPVHMPSTPLAVPA
jgi:signal transduction histidine kinase